MSLDDSLTKPITFLVRILAECSRLNLLLYENLIKQTTATVIHIDVAWNCQRQKEQLRELRI